MSGHSKWSTIKRKKAANDAKRGAVFTRLAREIAIAAQDGGDPDMNFGLRLAIDKAKAANMPKDNIERAIKRGTGEDKDGAAFEQLQYEGYGPHGVAIMIEVVTDNRNRTVADIRHILSKSGGNLAETGAVGWQFTRGSYFVIPAEGLDEDEIFEAAVEAGADDVIFGEEEVEILAPVEAFKSISDRLQALEIRPQESELRMFPNIELSLDPEQTVKAMRIIENLEDHDDVTAVFTNLEVTDEALVLLQDG